MFNWLLEIGGFGIVVLGFAYLVYMIFFSATGDAQRERRKQSMYRGFERRTPERVERRKNDDGPPAEAPDRRAGVRRVDD